MKIDSQKTRAQLRKQILAARDGLSPEYRAAASRAITERLCNQALYTGARTLFIYVNFRSEPDTASLIRRALADGKTVAVPYTVIGSRLLACRIEDPGRELRPGYCAIPEPDPDRSPPIAAGSIDLVILPGSVFDYRGGRLGYGGGYYDRFLAADAPQALRIGLAFEKQLVAKLPLLPHDISLHLLATEGRLLDFRNSPSNPPEEHTP